MLKRVDGLRTQLIYGIDDTIERYSIGTPMTMVELYAGTGTIIKP